MKTIKCNCGDDILVDDEDYDRLVICAWNCCDGTVRTMYEGTPRSIVIFLKPIPEKGKVIDHKDRNDHNNQKENLREATHSQNRINAGTKKTNRSGYKGVSYQPNMADWRARIFVKGKSIELGRFTNRTDAAKAYNQAAVKFYGEFAYINPV